VNQRGYTLFELLGVLIMIVSALISGTIVVLIIRALLKYINS